VTKLREALARIGDNPELYPEVHHRIRRPPIRRFPYGVFYRQMAERLVVIGIFHDRRGSSVWQSRA
jgi:plasmid stabilization system protein ParE